MGKIPWYGRAILDFEVDIVNYQQLTRRGVLCAIALTGLKPIVATEAHSADKNAIQAILEAFVVAWNKHDMKAMSELFSEDSDFVVVTAQHLRGRQEIYRYHDDLHKGLFKDSQRKARWEDLRFIRKDVAIGHIYFEHPDPKATGRASRTALALVVLSKDKNKWWIVSFQNTLKYGPPLPEQFPEKPK
jgi:uncharacterized protein (TIGR02246 family)